MGQATSNPNQQPPKFDHQAGLRSGSDERSPTTLSISGFGEWTEPVREMKVGVKESRHRSDRANR
jgi:hypothetical protein